MHDHRQILLDHKLPGEILTAAEIGDLSWFQLCLTNEKSKSSKEGLTLWMKVFHAQHSSAARNLIVSWTSLQAQISKSQPYCKGKQGESYLHIAAAHLRRNIIEYIYTTKIIDFNELDNNGRNALHWVLIWSATRKLNQKKVLSMVKLLQSYGKVSIQQVTTLVNSLKPFKVWISRSRITSVLYRYTMVPWRET